MKKCSCRSKKISDVVENEVVKKNAKFNTLKKKVNTSEQNIPNATTLIHINHTTQINKI